MYSIGDVIVSQGNSSFSSGSGQGYVSYSYDETLDGDYQYIHENYQYGERNYNQTQAYSTISESFYYYLDEDTSTVDQISMYRYENSYDNLGRIEKDIYISSRFYDDDDFSDTFETETFAYINSTSKKILQHLIERRNETDYSDTLTTTSYTYDYSGKTEDEIYDGRWDYTTRWGVETRIYNSEWSTDDVTTTYSKETRNNQNNSDSSSGIRVTTDDQGIITNTNSNSNSYSYGNNGSYTSSYSYKSASDYDGDGIVNYTYEHTSRDKNNQSSWTDLDKNDYDGDGYADYISMSRTSESARGRMTTEYRYDASSFSRPILEIIRSLDTDMDGTADLIDEKSVFRTLTARHTRMGGHVATLDDVLA